MVDPVDDVAETTIANSRLHSIQPIAAPSICHMVGDQPARVLKGLPYFSQRVADQVSGSSSAFVLAGRSRFVSGCRPGEEHQTKLADLDLIAVGQHR